MTGPRNDKYRLDVKVSFRCVDCNVTETYLVRRRPGKGRVRKRCGRCEQKLKDERYHKSPVRGRVTNWYNPKELIISIDGEITREKWFRQEMVRMGHKYEIKENEKGEIAIFKRTK